MNKEHFGVDVRNPGMPVENLLNIIGLILTSRKVKHNLPIDINIDPHAYVKAAPAGEYIIQTDLADLYRFTDKIGLQKTLTATVDVYTRFVRINITAI